MQGNCSCSSVVNVKKHAGLTLAGSRSSSSCYILLVLTDQYIIAFDFVLLIRLKYYLGVK